MRTTWNSDGHQERGWKLGEASLQCLGSVCKRVSRWPPVFECTLLSPSQLRSLVSGKAAALLVVISFNTRGITNLFLKINIIEITKYYRYTGELWGPRSQYNLKITINTTYTLNSVLLNVHMNPQKLLNRNPISAIALDGVQATLSSFLRTLQSMVLWWAMKKIESTMIISSNTYVECWCIVQCLNITFSRYFWW